MKKRLTPIFTEKNLEITQHKKNLIPCANNNAPQRLDLFCAQQPNMVIPLEAETPNFDSSMSQEYLCHSSCFQKEPAGSIITVHHKIHFQHRTVYVYDVNGKYDIFDTNGVITTSGFSIPCKTDFASCEIGVPYQIPEDEVFYRKYPGNFDPCTGVAGWGYNARCIISTNANNAQDSVAVSETLLRKLTVLKTKVVNINLRQKVLISTYPEIFPKVGQLLQGDVLLKICNDEGLITKLTQGTNVPSGYEDEEIVLEDNSYLGGIEVYCNSPIDNPHLEKLRLELLDFRKRVYNALQPIITKHPNHCSLEMKAFAEHCKYEKFRTEDLEIIHPLIKLTIHNISMADVGTKISNVYGGKVTIQHVYADWEKVDEYGRTIDIEYPSTAVINRSAAGILYENFMTSFSEELTYQVRNKLITKAKCYQFLQKFYKALGNDFKQYQQDAFHPEGHSPEFEYLNWDADTWWEYLQHNPLKIMVLPFSSGLNLNTSSEVLNIAIKYLGYRKLKCYTVENGDSQVIGRPSVTEKGEKIEMTSEHTVGTMFIFRDMHDPYYGSSSTSIIQRDIKGFPIEKDSGKRDGRTLTTKKPAKHDIQTKTNQTYMSSNADATLLMRDNSQSTYQIKEAMEANGASLYFEDAQE